MALVDIFHHSLSLKLIIYPFKLYLCWWSAKFISAAFLYLIHILSFSSII